MEIDKMKSFIKNIDKQVLNLIPIIESHNKTDTDINIKIKNLNDIDETKIQCENPNNMSFFNDMINDKSMSRGNKSLAEEDFLINHDEEVKNYFLNKFVGYSCSKC